MSSNLVPIAQVEKLRRQQKALASFGTFAFRQTSLQPVLDEAVRVCARCLDVPFSKVCQYRQLEDDLLVVAGSGWQNGVVGYAISIADETSPQGRAFKTGFPQFCPNIAVADTYAPPPFYQNHGIVSTVDVIVATKDGPAFGILEVDSRDVGRFDGHDIDFLTGFANVLAEAVATMERAEVLRSTLLGMERLVEEKEILSLELRHRVRNSLHLVYGLLTAELRGSHDKHSLAAFRAIAMRVMGLAEVFDHLLGTGMTRVIDFGTYVEALCAALPDLYQDQNIKLTCMVEPVRLELDVATSMGIVITELVSNAYLHAFPDGIGDVAVLLGVIPDRVLLSVADNGSGFVEHETNRRGVGLVRRLVERAGGNLTLKSDGGSTWTAELPMAALAPA